MMSFKKAACGLRMAAIFVCLLVLNVFAGVGTTGAEFLKVNVGGRASAFGGAYTAVSGDVVSAQYNPAGIAKMEKRELVFMHNEWLVDTRYEFLSFGMPVRNGAVALSIRYFDMGSFTGRDTLGQRTNDFKANDQAVSLSYAASFNDILSLGFSVMYVEQTIDSRSSNGIAADLGVNAEVIPGFLSLGASAMNLGPKMSAFENEKMDLPKSYNIGFAMTPSESSVLLTGDLSVPQNEDPYIALGMEYDVLGLIAVRGGANIGSGREGELSWCMGMGLNIWNYSLDYSFEPIGELDNTHRVSMSVKF